MDKFGCKVDKDTHIVKIPQEISVQVVQKMRDDYLKPDRPELMPVRFSHVRFQPVPYQVHHDFTVNTGAFCCFIHDLDGNRRQANRNDVLCSINMANSLEQIDYMGLPVSDQSVAPHHRPVVMAAELVKYTKKLGGIETFRKEDVSFIYEIAQVVAGSTEQFRKHPILVGYAEIRSPLCFDRNMVEIFIEYVKRGIPQTVDTMPAGGTTAPVTAGGILAQGTAETIAAMVLAYAIRDDAIIAMDIIPLYPEQYGAIAGSAKDSTRLCQVAESYGYGQDICAYARTSFGSIFSPEAPTPLSEIDGTGGLAKPDMLICGNNICGTVLKWYQDLSRYYKIPLFVFDTPPLPDGKISPHYIDYITTQMSDFVLFLEDQMKSRMDEENLYNTFLNSREAIQLWTKILELGKAKPAPLNCADRFLLMAPVVSQRGTEETIALYKEVLDEVHMRVDNNLGAITVPEEYRLLWDNIPIWFNIYFFFNTLAKKGVVFPADTYTHAWSQDFRESSDLLQDAAIMYSDIYLNKTVSDQ